MKNLLYILVLGVIFMSSFHNVFSSDVVHEVIDNQISSGGRPILIGTGTNFGTGVSYVNKLGNSDVRGNYFKGYYYDPFYGFFKLDWSTIPQENVYFAGGTSKCITGYGYRLDGAALSQSVGKIYFNYDINHQVYYCVNTNKLYGKAYSPVMGSQDFEGVSFTLLPPRIQQSTSYTGSTNFINDSTIIFYVNNQKDKLTSTQESSIRLGETTYIESGSEKIFYIFKPKK